MKSQSALILSLCALVVTGASASESRLEPDLVILPVYEINVPRYLPFEKELNAGLDAVRQLANVPLPVHADLPLAQAKAQRPNLAQSRIKPISQGTHS